MKLEARLCRAVAVPSAVDLSDVVVPAGTLVTVVAVESQRSPLDTCVFELGGLKYRAPIDALPPLDRRQLLNLAFDPLLEDFLAQEGVSGTPPSATWGDPGGRPTIQEINAFLAEKELQHRNAGTMSLEEFLRRKAVLMERIRRAEEEGR